MSVIYQRSWKTGKTKRAKHVFDSSSLYSISIIKKGCNKYVLNLPVTIQNILLFFF